MTRRNSIPRLILLLAILSLVASPLISQVNEDYIYEIRSVDEPGKCLDIESASTSNGVNAQIHPCNDGLNQRWKFVAAGSGFYKMIARHSGKCLDVKSASLSDGRNVQQYGCHGGLNQLWDPIPAGSNVKFLVKHSYKCLRARPAGFLGQRDILEQRTCTSDSRQEWTLVVKAICKNQVCESSQGETIACCREDCDPFCNYNGSCGIGENCSNCSADCGLCPNPICDPTCNGRRCNSDFDCGNSFCPQGFCDITGTCVCISASI
ncbi:MAG: RICIN domain-containing protein [Acidobacteriota bacterium]